MLYAATADTASAFILSCGSTAVYQRWPSRLLQCRYALLQRRPRLLSKRSDLPEHLRRSFLRPDFLTADYPSAICRGARARLKSESLHRTRPAQHAERPKGVPAARLAGAAFHLEMHRTRMRILERPSPILVTFRRHQIERLGDALVRSGARSAQVVEPPQDVVVPARGKRTLRPRGRFPKFSIEGDHLSSRSRSEQATLEEVFLSATASTGDVRRQTLRLFVLQQSFEHADRRVE